MSTNTTQGNNSPQRLLESLPEREKDRMNTLREDAITAMRLRGFSCTDRHLNQATFACGDFTAAVTVYPKGKTAYVVTMKSNDPEQATDIRYADTVAELLSVIESHGRVAGEVGETQLKLYDSLSGNGDAA